MNGSSFLLAIKNRIKDKFNSPTIYVDGVPENFQRPSFYIKQLTQSQEMTARDSFQRDMLYVVQYFGADAITNQGLYTVQEQMYEALDKIIVNNKPVYPESVNTEIVDNLITFTLSFSVKLVKQTAEQTKQGSLDITEGVK